MATAHIAGATEIVPAIDDPHWRDNLSLSPDGRACLGSEAAVRTALAPLCDELPSRGGNLFFRVRRR